MTNKKPSNPLQLGIDIGRCIAHTKCPNGNDLRGKATKIIAALGLDNALLEDPSLLIGLGFGVADRHDTPLDDATLDLMGQRWVARALVRNLAREQE